MEIARICKLLKKNVRVKNAPRVSVEQYNMLRDDINRRICAINITNDMSRDIMSARKYVDLCRHTNADIRVLCFLHEMLYELSTRVDTRIQYEQETEYIAGESAESIDIYIDDDDIRKYQLL